MKHRYREKTHSSTERWDRPSKASENNKAAMEAKDFATKQVLLLSPFHASCFSLSALISFFFSLVFLLFSLQFTTVAAIEFFCPRVALFLAFLFLSRWSSFLHSASVTVQSLHRLLTRLSSIRFSPLLPSLCFLSCRSLFALFFSRSSTHNKIREPV